MTEMTGQCMTGHHRTCKGGGGVHKNFLGKDTRYVCGCKCHKDVK